MSNPQPQPQLEYPYVAGPAGPTKPIQPSAVALRFAPTWLGLVGMVVVFAAANLLVIPLTEVFDKNDVGAHLVFASGGIVLAEVFVLATWLAFGPGPFLRRLALHWAALFAFGIIWLVGASASESFRRAALVDVLEVAPFSLPLFSLAIQLPLWMARYYFGWRLVDSCADQVAARPMGTRDLMLGTVIVAVSLALARLAEGMDRSSEGWLAWAILAPSLAGISLVSVLPVAVWLLRAKNVVLGIICIPVQATIAVLVTVTIVAMSEARINLREVFVIAAIVASFAAALSAAALAARAAGFRLQIGHFTSRLDAAPPPVQHA